MKFDQYTLFAQIPAGLLSMVPLIILHHFYINPDLDGLLITIFKITWVENITLLVVFVLMATELSRQLSKSLLETFYFKGRLYLPTTNALMHESDRFTTNFKQRIDDKLFNNFQVHLPNSQEQRRNEVKSRKKIAEAVKLIIAKVGKGKLVIVRNTQYGFSRNIIGASIIGLILSVFNIWFFNTIFINHPAVNISIVLCLVYILPIIFSKWLVNYTGNLYAEKLFEEYLATP